MNQKTPGLVVALGVAGLIPFALCGLGAVVTDQPYAGRALLALVAYGAVVLSFVGAVHWGLLMGLPEPGVTDAYLPRARLLWGIAASLIGWVSVLAYLWVAPSIALAVLIAGFVVMLVLEVGWNRRDLLPAGYMALRWVLSVVVVAILATVLVLHLFSARVVLGGFMP